MENAAALGGSKSGSGGPTLVRWIGAFLLFIVGYIHLALFFNMFGFNHILGALFLLNAVGSFVAMVSVLLNFRWVGWILGMVVAGGAAVIKLAMDFFPGVGALLLGGPRRGFRPPGSGSGPFGGRNFRPGFGAGGRHFGHFRPGAGHGILPLFLNIGTLGTVSIVIELVFVAIAVNALMARKKMAATKAG